MRIELVCGCGVPNENLQDWLCHWKHRSKMGAIRNFLLTEIRVIK